MKAGRELSRDFSWLFSLAAETNSSLTALDREFQLTR
jgi:hypothetical protein